MDIEIMINEMTQDVISHNDKDLQLRELVGWSMWFYRRSHLHYEEDKNKVINEIERLYEQVVRPKK